MSKEEIIGQILLLPITAIDYHLGKQLGELFPEKVFLEVEGGSSKWRTMPRLVNVS